MSNLTTINSSNSSLDMFEMMDKAYKFAGIMAKSDIIPAHYRGKPENVFIAVQTAYRMNLDPMLVMQNTFTISGKLGMNSTFAISLANKSGLFSNGIRYRYEGENDNLRITAYTNLKHTNEEISYTIGMKEAIAEGWTKNPKYKSLPTLMLSYRAATLLIRTHAPEVMNGMHMVEEIEDITLSRNVTPKAQTLSARLDDLINVEEANIPVAAKLSKLVLTHNVPNEVVYKWCEKAGVSALDELDDQKATSCVEYINNNYINEAETLSCKDL
jgi:hypothetical protein